MFQGGFEQQEGSVSGEGGSRISDVGSGREIVSGGDGIGRIGGYGEGEPGEVGQEVNLDLAVVVNEKNEKQPGTRCKESDGCANVSALRPMSNENVSLLRCLIFHVNGEKSLQAPRGAERDSAFNSFGRRRNLKSLIPLNIICL
mmetsp:Transcript_62072/g.183429  ORF Transcript_62072/g.183429 Transcript_62072/m.183429 type:complete len:144 (+) Transcript_62072:1212-1643(+)